MSEPRTLSHGSSTALGLLTYRLNSRPVTQVAADMGLQVAGDPLKVFPVLLKAIAGVADSRLRTEIEKHSLELTDEGPVMGTTIH